MEFINDQSNCVKEIGNRVKYFPEKNSCEDFALQFKNGSNHLVISSKLFKIADHKDYKFFQNNKKERNFLLRTIVQ